MKEPISVWTNLAYLLVGILILVFREGVALYVGVAFIGLGLGSAWFHWVLSPDAQLTDERWMYVAFTGLIAVAAEPFGVAGPYLAVAAVALGWVLFALARHPVVDSFVVTPLLVVLLLTLVALRHGLLLAGLLFCGYVVSVATRQLGILVSQELARRGDPNPHRWSDLFHGLWHLSTAAWMGLSLEVALMEG